MPLPTSGSRREIHHRQLEMRGYQREDGLFEIEGCVTDAKTYDFQPEGGREVPAGKPLHQMWVRLVVDDELLVHDAMAVTDANPYTACPDAAAAVAGLKGLRIASGWAKAVNELMGGVKGCTHIREMLMPLASAAFQTTTSARMAKPIKLDAAGRPTKLNSCHAYAVDGPLVLKRFPEFHASKAGAKTHTKTS